jgi:glycosyltransferase involved in cell wall biosynthesis
LLLGREAGGIADNVFGFAQSCDKKRVKIAIVILKRTDLIQEALRRGLDVHACPLRHGLDVLRVWRLCRLLRREKVELIHAHNAASCIVASVVSRLLPGLRFVASVRADVGRELTGSLGNGLRRNLVFACYRKALDRADRIVANSTAMKRWIVEHGAEEARVTVVHNGIDVLQADVPAEPKSSVPPRSPVIGTVGRFSPVKNHEYLLEAARTMVKRVPDLRIWLVGDGRQRARLERTCAAWGLRRNVVFTGWQSDVYAYVRGMDVFVLTSRSEGSSLALLQAMACRKPVVATAVGAVPELVEDGKTGVLVPLGEPERLAEAILSLLGDPERRTRLGGAARQRVERSFTIARATRETMAVYESLLGRAG